MADVSVSADQALEERVAEAATPAQRAALLGLDFPRLRRGVNRLYTVYFAVVAVPMLLALLASAQAADTNGPPLTLLVTLAGFAVALIFGAISTVLAVVVALIPVVRRLQPLKQQLVMIEVRLIAGLLGLFAATQLVHSPVWLLGVFVGALAAGMFAVIGNLAFVASIQRNRPGLVAMVRANEIFPAWLSPATGRVRWVALALVVHLIGVPFEVVLIAQAPLAALLLLVVGVPLHALGVLGIARNSPTLWLLSQIVWTATIVAATIILVPMS